MPPATNPPKQQRSRDSLERLLAAGLAVLEEHGVEGFTIAAVAERAGVGSTLVYRRFDDKNDLLGALFDRFTEGRIAQIAAAIETLSTAKLSFEQFIVKLTQLAADPFRNDANVMRAFISENRGDARLAQRVENGIAPLAREFERALLSQRAEFRCEDPEIAIAFCFQQMLNTFAAIVTNTSRVHPALGWDTVTRQLSLMTIAYLRAEPPNVV